MANNPIGIGATPSWAIVFITQCVMPINIVSYCFVSAGIVFWWWSGWGWGHLEPRNLADKEGHKKASIIASLQIDSISDFDTYGWLIWLGLCTLQTSGMSPHVSVSGKVTKLGPKSARVVWWGWRCGCLLSPGQKLFGGRNKQHSAMPPRDATHKCL